jgi:hypothetical protein
MHPETYSEWWDAKTDRVDPPGSAQPGQIIRAHSWAVGRSWPVETKVIQVDPNSHALDLRTLLPFGLVVDNHIRCTAVEGKEAETSRLAFG